MKCGGSCNQQIDYGRLSSETAAKTKRHPCYSAGAHHEYARMHLPVAPVCNVSCNYCNRKFDCVNESRPGVTSEILSPAEAEQKFLLVREKVEKLSVIGIAGPGDALANWEATKKSIELIKQKDPEVVFCLSTNGLMLPDYAQEIVDLGVNHVTVTMNTINPEIGALIYKYVNYRGAKCRGVYGAKILLENQLSGIRYLAERGVAVKVNIVMIKDLNDSQIPLVVKKAKELGAFITNIMPLIPAKGSAFENYPQTSTRDLNKMRDICQMDLQQMRHCRQCRADAIGMLGHDRSHEFSSAAAKAGTAETIYATEVTQGIEAAEAIKATEAIEAAAAKAGDSQGKYRIAVATKHGLMVDQHFGYAEVFAIYQGDADGFELLEKRHIEKYCLGMEQCDEEEDRRDKIINALKDCDAVLSMRIGYNARKRLTKNGIRSFETCDTIESGLNETVRILKGQKREIA